MSRSFIQNSRTRPWGPPRVKYPPQNDQVSFSLALLAFGPIAPTSTKVSQNSTYSEEVLPVLKLPKPTDQAFLLQPLHQGNHYHYCSNYYLVLES